MAIFNRKAKASKERDFDRSFVLLGKSGSGKSTLGNLLLGRKRFQTHKYGEAKSVTRVVQADETSINACQIYLHEKNHKLTLKIQIIDQPGSNDFDITQENYCEFLKQCIAMSKAEMSATFLVIIDLQHCRFTSEELLTILNLAEFLSDNDYSFFPNAIIVFTHADKCDKDLKEEKLDQILGEKLGQEEFTIIQDLMDLVDNRHIFVNATTESLVTRYEILRELFQHSRSSLTLYINGNNGFKGEELKSLFKEKIDISSCERSLLKYDFSYYFNPDLNLFRKFETKDIGKKIVDELYKLRGIGRGISTMVLLISLEEFFGREISNLIFNLPSTYNLGEKFKIDLWDYACILFKVPVDKENFVKDNINHNRKLQELVTKVNSRYAWVTSTTPEEECLKRIGELAKKVKLQSEGKSYTDKFILVEMKKTIREANDLNIKLRDEVRMVGDIKSDRIREHLPFYNVKGEEESGVWIKSNELSMKKDTISILKGYFILRDINPIMAEEFKEKYKDGAKTISNEEYANYCIKVMENHEW